MWGWLTVWCCMMQLNKAWGNQVPSLLLSIKICPITCFSENVSSVYFSLFPKVYLKEFFQFFLGLSLGEYMMCFDWNVLSCPCFLLRAQSSSCILVLNVGEETWNDFQVNLIFESSFLHDQHFVVDLDSELVSGIHLENQKDKIMEVPQWLTSSDFSHTFFCMTASLLFYQWAHIFTLLC